MTDAEPKFAMLNEAEIAVAKLHNDPYEYAFVEQAILPAIPRGGPGRCAARFPIAAAMACPI